MMDNQQTIEARLRGEELSPATIRSRDIGVFISSLEQMIASIVSRDNPALGLAENQVTLGLSAIQQGSYVMQFQTQYRDEVFRAYEIAISAINNNNFDVLPIRSLEAIKNIRTISRNYRTEIELGYRNGQFIPMASVSSNTIIDVKVQEISGETTLYGVLTGIVGTDPPSAKITLLNGEKISCNVTEKENLAVARKLGKYLYSEIGVRGAARWNLRDMSLTFFRIDEVLEYRATKLSEALENTYDSIGPYLEGIEGDDFIDFMEEIRGNNGAN